MSDFMNKADMLYEDVETFQNSIESIMETGDASQSDIVEAIGFQKESLKDSIVKCWKTRENYQNAADAAKAQADILMEKVKQMKARAADFETRANTMDEAIKAAMQAIGEDRVFTPYVTVSVKLSAPKVVVDDPDEVPSELRNEPKIPDPSKTKIKKYLAEHPDCDFAHLEQTLEIKYDIS